MAEVLRSYDKDITKREPSMRSTRSGKLSGLNQVHQELDELFLQHQIAVLHCDCAKAKDLLASYERGLSLHMKEENEILLPLYRDRAVNIRGGDTAIFSGEHEKIVEWLGRLKLRLTRIAAIDPLPKAVLGLLDDEAHFKKFVEHHTLRENRILYPELDRVTTPSEKAGLVRLLTFSLRDMDDPASDRQEV